VAVPVARDVFVGSSGCSCFPVARDVLVGSSGCSCFPAARDVLVGSSYSPLFLVIVSATDSVSSLNSLI
jgi:hypothetical protein